MPTDFEVIEGESAPGTIQEPVAPDSAPEPPVVSETPVPETTAPEPAPVVTAPPVEPPVPKGVQKRIDRLVAEREEFRRQLETARAAAPPQVPVPAPQVPVQAPPTVDKFERYEDFVVALSKYTYAEERRQEALAAEQKRIADEQTAAYATFRGRELRVMAEHEDYDDVANANALAAKGGLTLLMNTFMQTSNVGPDVLYYLGAHPDEAQAIAKMNPIQAARAMTKLESQFDTDRTAAPVVSRAPEPINPLTNHPPVTPPNRMTGMEMY